jgi:hypothetical protein
MTLTHRSIPAPSSFASSFNNNNNNNGDDTTNANNNSKQRRKRRRNDDNNSNGFPISIIELLVFVLFLTILILTVILLLCTTFLDNFHNNRKWKSFSQKIPLLEGATSLFSSFTDSPRQQQQQHRLGASASTLTKSREELLDALQDLDEAVRQNRPSITSTWVDTDLLLPNDKNHHVQRETRPKSIYNPHGVYFRVSRLANFPTTATNGQQQQQQQQTMAWQDEWKTFQEQHGNDDPVIVTPTVDYTHPNLYTYPERNITSFLSLQPLKDLLQAWPQDELDHPPHPIVMEETLQHFDFLTELDTAREYQQKYQVPFKLTGVPDLLKANQLWTDAYLSEAFDEDNNGNNNNNSHNNNNNHGKCQESPNHFFTYFAPNVWDVERMGLPPTRKNDWDFETWAQHARYADATGLTPDRPHFYYQASVYPEELLLKPPSEKHSSFLARDLPIFSSTSSTTTQSNNNNNKNNDMFVVPGLQKGMQCRFGERGVTTAAHFDAGKNMVAMITGAKRYILLPPNQCPKLGVLTGRGHSLYRHSVLNYGHFAHLLRNNDNKNNDNDTPQVEREWLQKAGDALAVETVLKAGEILYIPSHWFHYIVSLQKSAQCNIRSGVDVEGTAEFGGQAHVQPESCG